MRNIEIVIFKIIFTKIDDKLDDNYHFWSQ